MVGLVGALPILPVVGFGALQALVGLSPHRVAAELALEFGGVAGQLVGLGTGPLGQGAVGGGLGLEPFSSARLPPAGAVGVELLVGGAFGRLPGLCAESAPAAFDLLDRALAFRVDPQPVQLGVELGDAGAVAGFYRGFLLGELLAGTVGGGVVVGLLAFGVADGAGECGVGERAVDAVLPLGDQPLPFQTLGGVLDAASQLVPTLALQHLDPLRAELGDQCLSLCLDGLVGIQVAGPPGRDGLLAQLAPQVALLVGDRPRPWLRLRLRWGPVRLATRFRYWYG